MKVTRTGKSIRMVRDAADKPVVPRPNTNPAKVSRAVYNSWRTNYYLSFDNEAEAIKAETKLKSFYDFDSACVWLDKQ